MANEKVNVGYIVTSGKVKVTVILNKKGALTIHPRLDDSFSRDKFEFQDSTPGLVKDVANALLEAVEIAKAEEF